jgi:hypothetical protein
MSAPARVIPSSHSSLATFDTCPHQYEARYVIKDVKFTQGPEAEWGDAVHKALESYVRDGVALPANMRQYGRFAEGMRRRSQGGTLYAERAFAITIDRQPTEFFAPDVWLRSKIDVVLHFGHYAEVFDWKTGKQKSDQTQLRLYAAMVFIAFPDVQTIKAGYVWLKDAVVSAPAVYQRSQLDELLATFEEKHERVVAAYELGVFPPKPSGLCNGWCDVRRCSYWRPKRERR